MAFQRLCRVHDSLLAAPLGRAARGPPATLRVTLNTHNEGSALHRIRVWLGRPLLAGAARPWAGAVVACCVILVTVLGVLFAHKTRTDSFDNAVDAPIIELLRDHGGL